MSVPTRRSPWSGFPSVRIRHLRLQATTGAAAYRATPRAAVLSLEFIWSCHTSARRFETAPLRILCGPAEQHFANPRNTAAPLVQGSLGTTLLFHMIPRSLASDARWSKTPIFCTLRYSYAPTEPVEDYRVLSSQSEKSIGTMHTPATHRPVWLSRCRVGTRCVVGLKLLCGNARSPVM